MWTRTRVSQLLGLDFPIVQGPFGNGSSTPALASAVSNAGALGAFGAVSLAPEDIERTVTEIRSRTNRPFAVNLWIPISGQDDGPVAGPRFERQIEALLRAGPPVYSFVMGVPDRHVLAEIRRQGARSLGTATTVDEAVALEEAGIDVVVASGSDAGGHRGSFLRPVEQSLVGTMSLVPQIASVSRVPIIAAGGIADGRGIAAALALGAGGVQIGTAFLATTESGAPEAHKRVLGTSRGRITRLTRAISGRVARGIENELMLALEQHPEDILPYPAQYDATRDLRRAAAAAGRTELIALWAGQSAPLARAMGAATLVRVLAQETDAALGEPRMLPRSSPGQ
jgi:nitronate monooxygenase